MQNENNKNETLKESKTSPWLDWAVKLQAIAQAGLTYGKMFMTESVMSRFVILPQR